VSRAARATDVAIAAVATIAAVVAVIVQARNNGGPYGIFPSRSGTIMVGPLNGAVP